MSPGRKVGRFRFRAEAAEELPDNWQYAYPVASGNHYM